MFTPALRTPSPYWPTPATLGVQHLNSMKYMMFVVADHRLTGETRLAWRIFPLFAACHQRML